MICQWLLKDTLRVQIRSPTSDHSWPRRTSNSMSFPKSALSSCDMVAHSLRASSCSTLSSPSCSSLMHGCARSSKRCSQQRTSHGALCGCAGSVPDKPSACDWSLACPRAHMGPRGRRAGAGGGGGEHLPTPVTSQPHRKGEEHTRGRSCALGLQVWRTATLFFLQSQDDNIIMALQKHESDHRSHPLRRARGIAGLTGKISRVLGVIRILLAALCCSHPDSRRRLREASLGLDTGKDSLWSTMHLCLAMSSAFLRGLDVDHEDSDQRLWCYVAQERVDTSAPTTSRASPQDLHLTEDSLSPWMLLLVLARVRCAESHAMLAAVCCAGAACLPGSVLGHDTDIV
jgi:hypothetical protein